MVEITSYVDRNQMWSIIASMSRSLKQSMKTRFCVPTARFEDRKAVCIMWAKTWNMEPIPFKGLVDADSIKKQIRGELLLKLEVASDDDSLTRILSCYWLEPGWSINGPSIRMGELVSQWCNQCQEDICIQALDALLIGIDKYNLPHSAVRKILLALI